MMFKCASAGDVSCQKLGYWEQVVVECDDPVLRLNVNLLCSSTAVVACRSSASLSSRIDSVDV